MRFLTKYKRKCMSYVKTAGITALFLLVAVPFTKKLVGGTNNFAPGERYLVVLNGEELGYVDDRQVADAALLSAREEIKTNTSGLALVEADVEVFSDNKGGDVFTEAELSKTIYDKLSAKVVDVSQEVPAYTVRIDDFTVTLASKDEVSLLLEKVKDKYSEAEDFSLELVADESKAYSAYKTNFVSADMAINEASKVLASKNGTEDKKESKDKVTYKDGVLSVDFVENIEVIETRANKNVVSVDEAFEMITKEHAAKGTYKVEAGDCLSAIAKKHNITMDELFALNYGFNVDTAIYPGDTLTVTVPEAEISVVVVEEKTYKETYEAEIEYVDNDSLYIGTENVISEGVPGERTVIALVTSVNGVSKKKEIIKENISKKAVAKVVERGTLTPPTYIKPVNSWTITSPFGPRPDYPPSPYHYGVDWYVPTGTIVRASSSGVITGSGWSGGYGICVDIDHSNGVMTRYAHLSETLVSYGEYVKQGQIIGYSGATGLVTGPHLHFEIRIWGTAVDPLGYVSN